METNVCNLLLFIYYVRLIYCPILHEYYSQGAGEMYVIVLLPFFSKSTQSGTIDFRKGMTVKQIGNKLQTSCLT